MIVSRFESVCIRYFLGAVLDAIHRGVLAGDDAWIDALFDWLEAEGTTHDAQVEIDQGDPIRCL